MALPNTDTAGVWNKVVYQGDTFNWNFAVYELVNDVEVAVDLSGVTVTMSVKKVRGANVADLWTGSTTDGAIVVNGADDNIVNITIPATDMGGIPAGSWQYDVQFVDGAQVETYLTGAFTVTAEVTA